jgi:Zn-dependent M32 family carboxypeptidase
VNSSPWCVRSATSRRRTTTACIARSARRRNLASACQSPRRWGYDVARGRLDKTQHPFCTKFAAGDVRITTRVRESDLGDALLSTLHEAGHAIYEQGVNPAYEGTPHSGAGYRPVSMKANRGCGKTWSHAAGRSGSITTPNFNARLPISSDRSRSMCLIVPSTRWRARSSAPTLTK